jgi:hypothetical protein
MKVVGSRREACGGQMGSPSATARPVIMRWVSEVPSKIVKLSGVLALSSAHADDHALDLRSELWSLVDVFHCFPGSDGTETEQRAALAGAMLHGSQACPDDGR